MPLRVTVHRDPHRRRAHPLGRAGGPDGHLLAASNCTWTCSSWACMAWTREAGFTTPNLLEAETDRAFVAAAAQGGGAGGPHQVGHPGHQHHRRAGGRGRGHQRRRAGHRSAADPARARRAGCGWSGWGSVKPPEPASSSRSSDAVLPRLSADTEKILSTRRAFPALASMCCTRPAATADSKSEDTHGPLYLRRAGTSLLIGFSDGRAGGAALGRGPGTRPAGPVDAGGAGSAFRAWTSR